MDDVLAASATVKFGVGQPIRRVEDLRLLTGKGRYQDDQTMHRQTWCIFVRSPHAHALIRSINTDDASRAPGVLAVYTGADYANDGLSMPKASMPRKKRDGSPMFAPQRPALVIDRVRYVGDPVAMVIAETLAQAKDAAETGGGGLRIAAVGDIGRGGRRARCARACGTRIRTISRTPTNAATARRQRRHSPGPRGS